MTVSRDKVVRVWDFDKRDFLEAIHDNIDESAVSDVFLKSDYWAYWILAGQVELMIQDSVKKQSVAFYTEVYDLITPHLSGRQWAGVIGNCLNILRLEGDLEFELNN